MVSSSQNSRTSRSRCEMKTTVVPFSFWVRMTVPSQSTSGPDRADVGSSSSRILRLPVDGARDLDLLAHGEVEVADLVVQMDGLEAHRGEVFGDGLARAAAAHHAGRPDGRVGDQHVVEHGQVAHQGHFLECGLDAEAVRGLGRGEADRLAKDLDGAGVGGDKAGQDLDDGRLAGAVLAQQRMDGPLR